MFRSWQSYLFNGLLRLRRRALVKPEHFERVKRRLARIDARCADSLPAEFSLTSLEYSATEDSIDVDCLTTATTKNSRRIILYLHGGAFCLRAPHVYRNFLAKLCKATDAVGLLPDYRLAPNHPYPTAALDCYGVYQELLEQGYDAKDIAIAGDSAGGSLVLSTLLQIRQGSLPMPSCAVMLAPAADATFSGKSYFENVGKDPMFNVASLLFFRDFYLQGALPTDALASPLTQPFHGYPPLYISVGSTELLRDTAVAIAEKASREGIEAELDIWHGLCHVHQLMDFLPESKPAIKNIIAFLNRYWPASQGSESIAPDTHKAGETRQPPVG